MRPISRCIRMYNNISYDTHVCWREKNRSRTRTRGTCIIIVYIPVRIPELKVVVPSRMVSIGDGVRWMKKNFSTIWYDTKEVTNAKSIAHAAGIKLVRRMCIYIFFLHTRFNHILYHCNWDGDLNSFKMWK